VPLRGTALTLPVTGTPTPIRRVACPDCANTPDDGRAARCRAFGSRESGAAPRARGSPSTAALAAGVALEFFLDPRNGRRRRRLVRDRVRATLRRRARRVERQTRYEAGKVAGITHRITHPKHEPAELDDISLAHKVESELFRDRSIPKGRISINADRGIVVLRGQLDDARDIERVERQVRQVAGVRDVDSLLHLPGAPAPASRPHGEPRAASSSE
jgi:BON domain